MRFWFGNAERSLFFLSGNRPIFLMKKERLVDIQGRSKTTEIKSTKIPKICSTGAIAYSKRQIVTV
jgi:hypothetical protein